MPIVIALLVIIVLLLGGWWIFAIAIGAIVAAVAAVIAAIVWFFKATWWFWLGAVALFLALAVAGAIYETLQRRTGASGLIAAWRRRRDEHQRRKSPPLPTLLKSRGGARSQSPSASRSSDSSFQFCPACDGWSVGLTCSVCGAQRPKNAPIKAG